MAVEGGKLGAVHLGEHQSEASAHRDVINDDARLTLLREGIYISATAQPNGVAGGGIGYRGVREDLPLRVSPLFALRPQAFSMLMQSLMLSSFSLLGAPRISFTFALT